MVRMDGKSDIEGWVPHLKIIQQINYEMKKIEVNQWKNTNNITKRFINIESKKESAFSRFYTKEYYPLITEEILEEATAFFS